MKTRLIIAMACLTLCGGVTGLAPAPKEDARATDHGQQRRLSPNAALSPLPRRGAGGGLLERMGVPGVEQNLAKGHERGKRRLTAQIVAIVRLTGTLLSPATAEAAVVMTPNKKKTARRGNTALQSSQTPRKRGKVQQTPSPRVKLLTAAKKKRAAHPPLAAKAKTMRRPWSGGRCEPQSLTYARQRSGIMRSRTGRENGPLTWFASEKRLGMTSDHPVPGSVLILGADRGHGMPTGHVAYVEQVSASGPAAYKLTFSHTNYDRQCSLETNIEAVYNSSAKTLEIHSGAWQAWGRGLKVAGFIHQE